MTTQAAPRARVVDIVSFLFAMCVAPFVVTGILRVTPDAVPWPLMLGFGFLIALVVPAALWWVRQRAAAYGYLVGLAAWAVFLFVLIRDLDFGP